MSGIESEIINMCECVCCCCCFALIISMFSFVLGFSLFDNLFINALTSIIKKPFYWICSNILPYILIGGSLYFLFMTLKDLNQRQSKLTPSAIKSSRLHFLMELFKIILTQLFVISLAYLFRSVFIYYYFEHTFVLDEASVIAIALNVSSFITERGSLSTSNGFIANGIVIYYILQALRLIF